MIHTKDRWSCLKSSEEISNTKFPPLLPSSLIISTIFRCDHCGWTIALICYNLNFPLMKRGTLILASCRQSLAASSLISSEGATIDDDSLFSSPSTSLSNLVSNGVALSPLIIFLFSTMIEGIFLIVVADRFPSLRRSMCSLRHRRLLHPKSLLSLSNMVNFTKVTHGPSIKYSNEEPKDGRSRAMANGDDCSEPTFARSNIGAVVVMATFLSKLFNLWWFASPNETDLSTL